MFFFQSWRYSIAGIAISVFQKQITIWTLRCNQLKTGETGGWFVTIFCFVGNNAFTFKYFWSLFKFKNVTKHSAAKVQRIPCLILKFNIGN